MLTGPRTPVASSRTVRRTVHLLLLASGRQAAKNPSSVATKPNEMIAAPQLLSRHHGRNDHVNDAGPIPGQVDAQ